MNRHALVCIAAIAAVVFSCTERENPSHKDGEDPADTVRVDAGITVSLSADSLLWKRKELISVFSDKRQCPEPFEATDNGAESWFNGVKYKSDVLKTALHPYDSSARVQGVLLLTGVPNEQDGSGSALSLVGTSADGENFTMRRAGARIRFTVPEHSMISSIKFSTEEGLAGDVRIVIGKAGMELSGDGEPIRLSAPSDELPAGEYVIDAVPSSATRTLSVTYNGGTASETITLESGLPVGTTDIGELDYGRTQHPCLMFKKGDEAKILDRIHSSYDIRLLHDKILGIADESIGQISVYNVPKGGNMLYVSRNAVRYLSSMSYAYRMTGEKKYLDGAVAELEAVCGFKDWNPDHYLDMGEMATAVATAYDWLYPDLPLTTRKLCESALEEKALDTYLCGEYTSRWWYQVNNNRNQVCATGLYLAAKAIENVVPSKAATVIKKMQESIRYAVDGYDPDGAYMEGAGYWSYGTCYNALMNYTMERNGETPYYGGGGFDKTVGYVLHLKGPSGEVFNYSDGSAECDVDMGPFYFAQKDGKPEYLWWEMKAISNDFIYTDRMIPYIMPMLANLEIGGSIPAPSDLTWYGKGTTPVYFTRTSWTDPYASWFGIKGGYANTSHAHMDGGSFVFEAIGERWVIDQGGESYTTLTNNGVDQGNLSQNSPRWDVLAYAPSSHSCIRIDDDRLIVKGQAYIESVIDRTDRRGVVMNVSKLYDSGKVASLTREASLLIPSGIMEINDRIVTNSAVKYTFTLPTDKNTSATIVDSRTVRLSRGDKYLDVRVSPSDSAIVTQPATREIKPDNDYEKTDSRAVDFVCSLDSGVSVTINVQLVPMGAEDPRDDIDAGGSIYDREDFKW